MKAIPILMVLAIGGCGAAPKDSSAPIATAPRASGSVAPAPSASPLQRVVLPSDFPVMPGAASAPMRDDDPGLIGLWESDQQGSAAYEFYAAALPEAGYRIVGLYPGDEVALIRFGVPGGEIWQIVVRPAGDSRVAIEVRLDRP
jgi:hypothetical protein